MAQNINYSQIGFNFCGLFWFLFHFAFFKLQNYLESSKTDRTKKQRKVFKKNIATKDNTGLLIISALSLIQWIKKKYF